MKLAICLVVLCVLAQNGSSAPVDDEDKRIIQFTKDFINGLIIEPTNHIASGKKIPSLFKLNSIFFQFFELMV
jgi:hypothetical protein